MQHYDQEYLAMTEQFEQTKEELKHVKELLDRSQEDNAKQSRQLEELVAELALQRKTHKRNSSRNAMDISTTTTNNSNNNIISNNYDETVNKHLKASLETQKTENQKLLQEIMELKSKLNVKHKISNSTLNQSSDSISTTTSISSNSSIMMILYLIVGALVGFLLKYFL